MKSIIRKISFGSGYPNDAMHYQVGGRVSLAGHPYEISRIVKVNPNDKHDKSYDVYIKDDRGSVWWKRIENMPVVIENNVNFE